MWKENDAYFVEHDSMESALEMKDNLRDYGVYSVLSTKLSTDRWVVQIDYEYIFENFEREFLKVVK